MHKQVCHPKWLVRNTPQMKSQTHQTHTTLQYIAPDEIRRRFIPCEREKKCSRGRYGQTVNKRWVVTLHPSFCWPEVLQWSACSLKQMKQMWGPERCPPGSEPPPWPWVQPALYTAQHPWGLQLQAAPGTEYTAYRSVRRPLFHISAADVLSG